MCACAVRRQVGSNDMLHDLSLASAGGSISLHLREIAQEKLVHMSPQNNNHLGSPIYVILMLIKQNLCSQQIYK